MYLAGTVIFGGGPVVIPMLRSYVVDPGWVSSRDFLIGLAIIQAFPGPNFNFAVFLNALPNHPRRIPWWTWDLLPRDHACCCNPVLLACLAEAEVCY